MGAVTKAELEAMVKRLQRSLDQSEAEKARLAKSLDRAKAKDKAHRKAMNDAYEQQRATAEILSLIVRSSTNAQPVFDTIVKSGARLFSGMNMSLRLVVGDHIEFVASTIDPEGDRAPTPLTNQRHTAVRAIRRHDAVQIPDVTLDDYFDDAQKARAVRRRYRAVLSVPLLRKGDAIGAINLLRAAPGPFTQQEIALLKTFADQAVIAIENARLFKEINEALAQQTATTNVLKLISRTTFELQPVLDTLVRSAAELCDADHALYFRVDLDAHRLEAWHNVPNEYVEYRRAHPLPLSRDIIAARAALTREPALEEDMSAQVLTYDLRVAATLGGIRSGLCVPVLREGEAIGVIGVFRREVRPFSEQNIALLKTFADQAVIAIENVRLFKELEARNAEITEALEQQTATADILKVISSSPTDVQPVFDAIIKSALHLFSGQTVAVRLLRGDPLELTASSYLSAVGHEFSVPLDGHSGVSQAIQRREVVQIPDLLAEEWIDERMKEQARRRGYRATLCAPMMREDTVIGTIAINRPAPGLYSEKEIALLRTFADQAVIAIENVRLFKELQAKNAELTETLEQQTATSEILRIISRSVTNAQPVFDAIVNLGARLFNGTQMTLRLVMGDHHVRAASTINPNMPYRLRAPSRRPLIDEGNATTRAIRRKEVVNIADFSTLDWLNAETKRRHEDHSAISQS